MPRKVAYFTIALLLAWHFGPLMTMLFWFLPIRELVDFLAPKNIFSHDASWYLGFVIWLIIFWIALDSVGILGLASPAQGASNTKPVRRIQGLLAEGLLVAIFCAPALALLTLTIGKSIILDHLERKSATAFVATAMEPMLAQLGELDRTISGNDSDRGVLTMERFFQNMADSFRPPEKLGEAPAAVQRKLDQTQIRGSALEGKRKQIQSDITSLTAAYAAGQREAVARMREAVWHAEIQRPWRLGYLAIVNLWMYALPFGAALYFFLHRKVKYGLGERLEKVLRFFREMKMGFGGSSAMAGLFEEWALKRDVQNLGDGIFMGRSLYNPSLLLSLKDERHMLTIAGSRTGKGSTTIIPTLLEWTGSVIVPDIKGSNAAVTARRRREMGQEVIIIDPFHVVTKESDGYNPLADLDPNSPTIREEIEVIAEALVIPNPDPKAEHWDEGALTIIAGLIDYLTSSGKYESPTLPMIRDLMSLPEDLEDLDNPDEENQDVGDEGNNEDEQVSPEEEEQEGPPETLNRLWAEMLLSESLAGLARDAASMIIGGAGTDELSGFLSNARKNTKWLGSKSIQKVLSQNRPSPFAMAKRKPTSIYIVLPAQWYSTHKRLMRLYINLGIMAMSVGDPAEVCNLMILDEFLALGKLAEVERAYNLMAGYNLIIWALAQNYGGMEELYGSAVQSFVTNSRAVQVFGVSDTRTTTFIADQIGEWSLLTAWGSRKSNSIVRVRTPTEIATDLEQSTRRQYIIRPGKPVILAERIDYFKPAGEALFAGKHDPDPAHIKKERKA